MNRKTTFNAGVLICAFGAAYIILYFTNIMWQKTQHITLRGFPFTFIPLWMQFAIAIGIALIGGFIAIKNKPENEYEK